MNISTTNNIFGELQKQIADILNQDSYISGLGITVLPENLLDIEYQIQTAMQKQGLCVIVMFEEATYEGAFEDKSQAWTLGMTIQAVENPTLWRARLKKDNKTYGTCTDIISKISDILSSPTSDTYGKFTSRSIQIGEDSGLLVGKYTFACTIYSE